MPEILIHTPINLKILGTDSMGEQMEADSVGRDSWNGRAFGGNVEMQCIRNSQESVRVTLAKTLSDGGHGA